jgi:hypothetical protein
VAVAPGGPHDHVVDGDVLAVEGDRFTGPQQRDGLQALVQQTGQNLGVGGLAEAAVLVVDRVAKADPEDHAAA